jgi:mRNA-degrading endonuclease RelE of RelBE toxin-antitoxin system
MTKNLVKKHLNEHLLEALLDEDYPTNWNAEEFKQQRSFAARKKYCDTNLQKISSGTGRIVYKIDNEKVLKLAKNQKGVAQNEVEASFSNDYYFESILAKTFDSDPNDLWIEMELARKVTPTIWKKLFKFDINIINDYLHEMYALRHNVRYYGNKLPEDIINELHENEDVKALYEFGDANDSVGDLGKLSSYGLVKRDGHDSIVIIDYGLTGAIYDSYYS